MYTLSRDTSMPHFRPKIYLYLHRHTFDVRRASTYNFYGLFFSLLILSHRYVIAMISVCACVYIWPNWNVQLSYHKLFSTKISSCDRLNIQLVFVSSSVRIFVSFLALFFSVFCVESWIQFSICRSLVYSRNENKDTVNGIIVNRNREFEGKRIRENK